MTMRLLKNFATSVIVLLWVASFASGAEVTGTVKGPDGAPFQGAFVQARNIKTKITVSVLSRKDGQYRIPNLPAGDYELRIRAVGYQAQPRTGVNLTADQSASFEFALQKGKVHWTDISLYQADQLLPAGKGKDALFTPHPGQPTATCAACHGIQTRIASTARDEAGWRDRVEYEQRLWRRFDPREIARGFARIPESCAIVWRRRHENRLRRIRSWRKVSLERCSRQKRKCLDPL